MEFVLHPNPEMGLYKEEDPIFGIKEWAFPLTDDERSNAYRQWRDSQQ